jgi:hypothetical protein
MKTHINAIFVLLKRSLWLSAALTAMGPRAAAQFVEPYEVHGSSDLDMSTCNPQGPTGEVSRTFWVLRRYDIAGPTQVSINNVPPGVSVTISPATLTYPGAVTGQQVTATFRLNVDTAIPDVPVQIVVSDSANSVSAELLLHGTCPRHNRDAVIRGWFASVHRGVAFPLEGALVEIYRDVPWQLDDWVGSTITAADGSFEVKLWTGTEGTYYAKLRLNDVAGVYLHDWWTPSIKDYNSVNRGSNIQPIVDLGGTVITKDGGQGTPKASVWQGGRAAYQEFIHTFGRQPPIGDYEIVNQNWDFTPFTARSTTNWKEGYDTFKFSNEAPTAQTDPAFDAYFSQFLNYSVNFHEFGHALRHTVDGDQRHFTDDASRWTYGRKHSLCGSDKGYVDIEAFAFNEGWAEFWAMDTGDLFKFICPEVPLDDMTKEGAVMNDMYTVAHAIDACLPPVADRAELFRAERRNLFSVVNRGQNIMHSEGEFRSNAQQQFPGCALPPVGLGIASSPLTVHGHIPTTALATVPNRLASRAAFYRDESARLTKELALATRVARKSRDCKTIPCKTFAANLIYPHVLRGQIDYTNLISQTFARRNAALQATRTELPDISEEGMKREQAQRDEFRRAVLKIALKMLDDGEKALARPSERDDTGELRRIAENLKRASRRLQLRAPANDELFALFRLSLPEDDDHTEPAPKQK